MRFSKFKHWLNHLKSHKAKNGSFISNVRSYKILRFPKPCSQDTRLLIAIKTESRFPEHRIAIRKYWGNQKFYNKPIRLVFLFGKDAMKIYEDEKIHEDLLIGDFEESFYNMTMKDSMLLTWATSGCKVPFIFKGLKIMQLTPLTFFRR